MAKIYSGKIKGDLVLGKEDDATQVTSIGGYLYVRQGATCRCSPAEARLRTMVAEHYCRPAADIVPDASFEADLGGDSLDSVEFAMAVEEEFQIELSDDEADAALGPDGTFGKLCALVERKLTQAANG